MVTNHIVLIFLAACIGVSAQISTPTLFQPQIFDVQHYDATIAFPDPAARTIIADVSIVVRWTSAAPAPAFPFHLRGLLIDSVFVNGAPSTVATFGVDASDTMHHRVTIGRNVVAGNLDTIRVFYHGTMTNEGGTRPWGGVHFQDSVLYAMGVGFKNVYVSSTQHWLACYDHPSDKATFSAQFVVPNTIWVVASVGKEITNRPPGTLDSTIYRWSEDHPTATYLLTFAVAPYKKIELPSDVPHVFYTLARDSAKSAKSYSRVPHMTTLFANTYGAYPFDKVGFCNTVEGSMEHQSMISFKLSIAQSGETQNRTAAHELAHQWFGDCVSPVDYRYAWLTESFATYSESVWLEEILGFSVYLKSISETATAYIKQVSKSEGVFALEDFPRQAPSSNYPQTIYGKGAVVVAMMRAIAGDEPFTQALQGYIQSHRYATAATIDMKNAMRSALGAKTDRFFDEWVTGIGWPQLNINIGQDGSDAKITIHQVQQNLHPTWPIFTSLPLNVVYTRNGFAGIDTLDVVMYCDSTGLIEFNCTELLSVNAGARCRSLVETMRTTSTMDFFEGNTTLVNPSLRAGFALAPNPANDSITLVRSDARSSIIVRIVDMQGSTLHTQTCGANESNCLISTRSLSNGAYNIIVDGGKTPVRLPLNITRGE